nr:hypothetical protein [Tanacetum cinerariifolium]
MRLLPSSIVSSTSPLSQFPSLVKIERILLPKLYLNQLMSSLPSASRREDRPEVTLPPQKRLDIALGPRYEVGESSSAAAARPAGDFRRAPVSTDAELGRYVSQMSEIKELHAADRRRQTVILELLRIDHRRSIEISELRTALQGQVTALQAQVTTLQGQQGLVGDYTQSELPEEAGGSA